MAIKLASNLSRNRYGVLHFRMAIPPDLRNHFEVKEIYRSLRTASIKDAVEQAQTLSIALKRAFAAIRQQTMSNEKKTSTGRSGAAEPLSIGLQMEFHPTGGLSRFVTEPHDTPEVIQQALAKISAIPIFPTSAHAETKPASFPMSHYLDAWIESFSFAEKPIKDKTLGSYRAAVEQLIKIVGDKPVGEFCFADQNRFDDVIVRLPTNCTKMAETKDLTIDGILGLGLPRNSIVNAKNIARRATTFLKWACKREGIKFQFQLCDDIKLKKSSRKKRRAFSNDELRIVFNPEVFGKSPQAGPYIFWLPLIGVHTGMRINEIGQLLLSDLVLKDGVHCFDVNDEPDQYEEADLIVESSKSIKTEASRRLVPIHSRLIELGLLEYADALQKKGHKRLFPDLSDSGRDGPGQPASKQFAGYCDRIGLTDPMLVFHSFRHGAVGGMRSAGVQKELRMVVVGHSALEDTHDLYGDINNDHTIISKQGAIEALKFDCLNYSALRAEAPTVRDLENWLAPSPARPAKPKVSRAANSVKLAD